MYLFQHAGSNSGVSVFLYLHSTMYLFQLLGNYPHTIPTVYLHSTMYLFQLFASLTQSLKKHHLHSTMYLFQLRSLSFLSTSKVIYIPLCIYFNVLSIMSCPVQHQFTFHYVSISTITAQSTFY